MTARKTSLKFSQSEYLPENFGKSNFGNDCNETLVVWAELGRTVAALKLEAATAAKEKLKNKHESYQASRVSKFSRDQPER